MKILRICKQLCCSFILIYLCGITVAFGNEAVTRTGFVQSIDLKAHRIVVDDNVYKFSKHTKVILNEEKVDIRKLQEGDFVVLAVKKANSMIQEIIIQSIASME